MEINIRSVSAYQVIAVKGELGLYGVPEASRWMETALASPGLDVALDLAGLEFIDSSGIAAIVHWRKQVVDGGGRFVLLAVPENLRRVLELSRLHQRIQFLDSEAELTDS
ncbi:MAG: STAS domain-containing protein [bacterium]|nr:STAS domain-containing protein [bacterium]